MNMRQAKMGDTVKINYTGKLEDGTLVDSTDGRGPFEMTLGEGATVPGLELGIVGLVAGDKRTLTLNPADGFGNRRKKAEAKIKRSDFPDSITPVVGMQLEMPEEDGMVCRVAITAVGDKNVTVDTNHPLAGKIMIFDVEVLEVVAGPDLPEAPEA
jgi:peptidylprolyl isomerase